MELLVEANARLERLGLGALVSTRRHLVIGTGTPEEPRGNAALATVDLSKLVLLQGYLFMVLNERLEELRLEALVRTESYMIMAHLHSLPALRLPALEAIGAVSARQSSPPSVSSVLTSRPRCWVALCAERLRLFDGLARPAAGERGLVPLSAAAGGAHHAG